VLPADVVELLHCLGYVYLRHGQSRRAVVLLLIAASSGAKPPLLAALALALIESGMGEAALDVLDRVTQIDPGFGADGRIAVLRARALLADGQHEAARSAFAAARTRTDPVS
jgi:type III secretion protein Y